MNEHSTGEQDGIEEGSESTLTHRRLSGTRPEFQDPSPLPPKERKHVKTIQNFRKLAHESMSTVDLGIAQELRWQQLLVVEALGGAEVTKSFTPE